MVNGPAEKYQREDAVRELVDKAYELRRRFNYLPEVMPPEILLILAWEAAVLRRYQEYYDNAPVEVRLSIDQSKAECRSRQDSLIDVANTLVKDGMPTVLNIKCKSCQDDREMLDIISNAALSRPLWTFF